MPSLMTVSEQAKSSFDFERHEKTLHCDVHFGPAAKGKADIKRAVIRGVPL